jgi:putative ABC transport system substrate-binding protein
MVIDLALERRLPTAFGVPFLAREGALVALGANPADIYTRAAMQVDKILKGAKPGDLPIEQPSRYELVINLRTAKMLGLTIPSSLLLRADQLVE